jgi:hypothetical protein
MNALLAKVVNKKTLLIANEGRLLKKCILGFLILVFSFQSSGFGQIIRELLVDAYLQVSVFVGFTLFIFIGLDSLTKFNVSDFLKKTKKAHVVICSILGALPGCGGAIVVVTQYIQGRISFGSLVAVLTSTMGDAAFLLLSKEPSKGLLVFLIAGTTGIISGYIIDFFKKEKYFNTKETLKVVFEKINITWVSRFNILWLIVFFPGFILGFLLAFQVDINKYLNFSNNLNIVELIGSIGAIISIFMWALNPLSDFQCSTEKSRSYLSRVVDTTNFVTTWVISAFLIYESFVYFTAIDLSILFNVWTPLIPFVAIFLGFIPGCGPQILVTTFYLNGVIPFSAELGNAISNDGDALFPAIALAPKDAISATLYSAIPAVIVAYSYMFLFEI